ncbi:MAG: tRNA (adenosine(37)-N6)-threonylcarbamoyltransferase complex transferase subunit TsaD [bacterium]|nr:tRNA (adenosine(37)-N6)-threonylcarbamoyltransferase complex transferase subunit TsaD [bacterium]
MTLAVCTTTQTVHRRFGGVVPELAGRSHLELVDAISRDAVAQSGQSLSAIDVIAATIGPGLVASLLVGAMYAQGLALATGKPFHAIHHVEAHLWSAELLAGELPLPFLVLLVSGGHTLLVEVSGLRRYRVLGTTLDDALGEAYDKVGKLVGFDFPAGASVDRAAAVGNPRAFDFPISKSDDSYDFSFSGLKTAVLYTQRAIPSAEMPNHTADLLASFQEAALESVAMKIRRALRRSNFRALVAAGGVAANSRLRVMLREISREAGISCVVPPPEYCMDNAAMVGYLAWKLRSQNVRVPSDTSVRPRWSLTDLAREECLP